MKELVPTESGRKETASLWKRINGRGGSFLPLVILFGITALSHLMAFGKMGLPFALVDDRTMGEIHLIQLVQDHIWVLAIYFALLITAWFWLAVRSASRLVTLISLLFLSVPGLLYIRACVHIGSKLLGITGP